MKNSIYKNNKSGVRGVSFETRSQRWRAYIQVDKKRNYLGYFQTKEEAVEARINAEQFNLFNRTNFDDSDYPLIDFVLEKKLNISKSLINKDLYFSALGMLLTIISDYSGIEVFITYAIRELANKVNDENFYDEALKRKAEVYINEIPNSKEKECVDLCLKGYSALEIANELEICINTTYKYLKLSINKLKEELNYYD